MPSSSQRRRRWGGGTATRRAVAALIAGLRIALGAAVAALLASRGAGESHACGVSSRAPVVQTVVAGKRICARKQWQHTKSQSRVQQHLTWQYENERVGKELMMSVGAHHRSASRWDHHSPNPLLHPQSVDRIRLCFRLCPQGHRRCAHGGRRGRRQSHPSTANCRPSPSAALS